VWPSGKEGETRKIRLQVLLTVFKGRFLFTKNFGKFPLGISVCEERVPFAASSIRGSRGTPGRLKHRERSGPGDKNNKNENSLNDKQIFHWEVSTGKTGLPF